MRGVVLDDGSRVRAPVVVCNADPFRMRDLVGRALSRSVQRAHRRIPARRHNAEGEPRAPGPAAVHVRAARGRKPSVGPTIHLLPEERDVIASLEKGFADVEAGRLPEFPTIEWYLHTTVDRR